jgi:hypothetical protein
VALEQDLHLPAKARLSWYISRLRLDAASAVWIATGSKGNRVAVIPLPPLVDPEQEEAWLAQIEASFEEHAFDPTQEQYLGSAI